MKLRLIPLSAPSSGAFNMAADHWCSIETTRTGYGFIRFYTWSPPAVSLGYHQTTRDIDLNRARALGWEVVKRPTGGRALLHGWDLSYSIIIPASDNGLQTLKSVYQTVATAFNEVVNHYNDFFAGEIRPIRDVAMSRKDKLCLTTKVRGEVSHHGRKLMAAAQRLYAGAILHHGSILLSGDPGLIGLAAPVEEGERPALMERLRAAATTIYALTGCEISAEAIAADFESALRNQIRATIINQPFSNDELHAIRGLEPQFVLQEDFKSATAGTYDFSPPKLVDFCKNERFTRHPTSLGG